MFGIDRTAGFHAGFDELRQVPIEAGPVTVWLDGGVVEVESADGRDWFSAQHRLFSETATLTMSTDRPLPIEIATFDPAAAPSSVVRDSDVEGEGQPLACANRRG